MLQRLGIGALAYDWRDSDVPTFDEELLQLRAHGIRMSAFWLSGGSSADEKGVWEDPKLRVALDFVRRNDLQVEVWKTLGGRDLDSVSDEGERYDLATRGVRAVAKAFGDLGCRYGLYNHGGWGGEPTTMVEVAKRLDSEDVGIVYNFHHGHEHLQQMPEAFSSMLRYLMGVNLNGVTPGGPKILPIGEGEADQGILEMIRDSGYGGPIGILDHRPETDAEMSLKQNLAGLKRLLGTIGDEEALATYR